MKNFKQLVVRKLLRGVTEVLMMELLGEYLEPNLQRK